MALITDIVAVQPASSGYAPRYANWSTRPTSRNRAAAVTRTDDTPLSISPVLRRACSAAAQGHDARALRDPKCGPVPMTGPR